MSAMQVPTATPASIDTMTPTPRPSSTATAQPTATADGAQIVTVSQPVVRVRLTAGGDPTGEYLTAGQSVEVLEIVGDWARIAEPAGYVWVGCLDGISDKKCEAAP